MTDEQLIAVLDNRFFAFAHQLGARFDQVDSRFAQIDRRFERIEERLGAVETEVRHAHIQIEGLRGEIRTVAESVLIVDVKLERFRAETAQNFVRIEQPLVLLEAR